MPVTLAPRPPLRLDSVLDDPALIRELLHLRTPYAHVLQLPELVKSRQALAVGDDAANPYMVRNDRDELVMGGVFRDTWADGELLVPEAAPLFANDRLIGAARELFGAERVRPHLLYVNLTTPMPMNEKHTDIATFRGIERSAYPTWVVGGMAGSGLFERWRVKVATAVAWYYEGPEGGFSYWPEGGDGPVVTIAPPVNSAVMGDNDFMPHRVEQVGDGTRPLLFPIDALLHLDADGSWRVTMQREERARLGFDDVRVSVSWKARVFDDEHEERIYLDHLDDIGFDEVVERWRDDLAGRGVDLPPTDEALTNPAFGRTITREYLGGAIS